MAAGMYVICLNRDQLIQQGKEAGVCECLFMAQWTHMDFDLMMYSGGYNNEIH